MTNEDLTEARELGKILPHNRTTEQRDRVIYLTKLSAEFVDEMILVSERINGPGGLQSTACRHAFEMFSCDSKEKL